MVGFQFTIAYDKTKLTYINCTNWATGINATQVQINSLDGKLTFVYTDAAINIANGKFFDLNFTVLNGASGNAAISWSDNPTQRELSNSIPNEISCEYSNGSVAISVEPLLAPVATAATNITQTSFSSNWNSSVSATGYRLDVAKDIGFTNYLTGYQNKDVGNVTTLPISGCVANTIYYYRVKAYNAGETSGASNTIIATTPPIQSGATLKIGNSPGSAGNSVFVPIQATDIIDMVGFQFTIVYDKTKLTYINCTNWATGINAAQVQINSLDGKLTFVYTDAAINIANGKFFDLNFTVLNGASGNAAISWSDNPTKKELSNSIPNEISCGYTNGAVEINCTAPISPSSAKGSQTTINSGQSTTLQVNGGTLNSAPDWIWYTGGCGVSQAGTGTTLSVSPTATTTYYVQASACETTTTCRSVTITVTQEPCSLSLSANRLDYKISAGSKSVTVTSNSSWTVVSDDPTWISVTPTSGSNSGSLSVSVTANTGAERRGTVTVTCGGVTKQITVIQEAYCTPPISPTSVTASQTSISPGQLVILSINGGVLHSAPEWEWYTGGCGMTKIGSGESLTVTPTKTTTYYVQAKACGDSTICRSVTINVSTINPNTDDFYITNASLSTTSAEPGGTVDVYCDQCYTGLKTDSKMGNVFVGYYLSDTPGFNPATRHPAWY